MKVSTDNLVYLPWAFNWKYITRGDDPKKVLSEKAKNLLSQIVYELEESKNEAIFVDHEFLSQFTDRSAKQNKRILKQLSDIIQFRYFPSVRLNDVTHFFGYVTQFTKDGKDRITNPLNFYSKV